MKPYLEKHHTLIGAMGALIACIVAIVYLFIVPEEASGAGLIQKSILTYAHSLCWFLLAAASTLWAIKGSNVWSVRLAYLALAVYLTFLAVFVLY